MNAVTQLIKRKPLVFVVSSLVYLLAVGLLKWGIHPSVETLIFLLGGVVGVYFLDAAEVFFDLSPSPFRSALFAGLFVLVGLFVVTSSGSHLASGLVLSLYLSMILWMVGEFRIGRNINTWFRLFVVPVAPSVQQYAMIVFIVLFLVFTVFYVR
jgi:hypothetical protein